VAVPATDASRSRTAAMGEPSFALAGCRRLPLPAMKGMVRPVPTQAFVLGRPAGARRRSSCSTDQGASASLSLVHKGSTGARAVTTPSSPQTRRSPSQRGCCARSSASSSRSRTTSPAPARRAPHATDRLRPRPRDAPRPHDAVAARHRLQAPRRGGGRGADPAAIALSPANEHDGHHAGALVDQQPERRRPKRVIGDTAYGNIEARELLEQRSVSVLAPVHSTSPKDGSIPKDEFAIDLETDTVTCPAATRHRSTSPVGIAPMRAVSGSPASREATASPARSGRAARRAASATSASDAARTCARPRSRRYPIPPSATISSAPRR
jgi:hypothetical protein